MATNNNADDTEVEPTSPAALSGSTGSGYAKGRGRSKAFTSNDTLILARVYMDVSTDAAKGTILPPTHIGNRLRTNSTSY